MAASTVFEIAARIARSESPKTKAERIWAGSIILRRQLSRPAGNIGGPLTRLALAIAYTLMVIEFSLRHGRLVLFPTFDDLAYFFDGAERLQSFYDSGVVAVAHGFVKNPPHSPYQTLEAFFCFLIFGMRGWAPYVGNAGLILFFITLANRLARGLRTWHKICLTLLVLSFPLVPYAAMDCRPDFAAAVVTVAGVCTLLGRPTRGIGFVQSPDRHKIASGALFGLAMLVKPTVSPVTIMVMVNCLLAASVCDWFDPSAGKGFRARGIRHAIRALARAWGWCIAAFLIVAGPYFLVSGKTIVEYIWDNTFGSQSYLCKVNYSIIDHLRFYLVGPAGIAMLGNHWILVVVIFALGLAFVLVRRRRREMLRTAAYSWVLCFTYFICTGNQVKTPYLGLSFQVMFIFLAIVILRNLALSQRLRGQLPWGDLILVSASVCGALLFTWPESWGQGGSDSARAQWAIVNDVYQTIRARSETARPVFGVPWEKAKGRGPVVLLTFSGSLNADLLNYTALQNLTPIQFDDMGYTRSPDEYLKRFDLTDFVIVSDPDMDKGLGRGENFLATNLPNWALQDQLHDALKQRTDYKLAAQIQYHSNHKNLYVFERAGEFYGLKPVSGVAPIEGPYLPGLPFHVRWGVLPNSQFEPVDTSPGSYELTLSGRSPVAAETMIVQLDGQEIGNHKFIDWNFATMKFPVKLSAGAHLITIEYSGGTGSNQAAVLYREMKLVKTRG